MQNTGDGSGQIIQIFPLKTGSQARTVGAASIDVSDAKVFVADTNCNIYEGTDTANYFLLTAGTPRGVATIDSLHVDAALGYALI